ncbi:MAG TPA: phasin family protein [Candidatus Binatia bacterium]|nr:phasin family protein [Candidatus Binatia bacterium]
MTLDKAVNEVKGRLEDVGAQAQGVAKVSYKTIKAANEVVIEGVQDLVKTQTEAAKDLYTLSKHSFDKAYAAGLLAVAQSPIEYIPDGRDTIIGAFTESVETFTKTGEKLAKVVKTGYRDVSATFGGKPARKTRKAARRVTRKAKAATHAETAAA